jgi:GNAT superfamily N-acetyltransferase
MNLVVRPVNSKHELKLFIYLPEKLYQNYPNWVPPLYRDEFRFFNPRHNAAFKTNDTILALAWRGNQAVGRIMGIINHHYNSRQNERHARFCFLDCPDDEEVCKALIHFVEKWAIGKEMTHLVGPLGFSDKDPQGLMIEGYDEQAVIATNLNPPYLPSIVTRHGFEKLYDLVSYLVPLPSRLPESYQRVIERLEGIQKFKLIEFSSKKQLKPWIKPVFQLINIAYGNIYGFDPLSDQEMRELAGRYLPVLNPKFVKIIVDLQGKMLAFAISMPELSEGIRKARGRIFPFGWWHIIRSGRKTKLLTMLLGAVHPNNRNHGFTILLAKSLIETAHQHGITHLDSHLILEYNKPMRSEYERLQGRLHKRFRIYIKPLNAESKAL